jgi:uncharacterized protein YecE (DUF72 family)
MDDPAILRLGTSAFTAAGWPGSFYPADLPEREYLSYYARHFDTVEVDSTFYRSPAASTVRGWYEKTPKGFLFAAKVPQQITHEKMLVECQDDLANFLKAMDLLREKLGPLLFQFPYFNRSKFKSGGEFVALLKPFLKALPKGYRYAVEIRNRQWLDARFADTLRERGLALALVDHAWMPRPAELFAKMDPITADFTYIRWLGDRKGIEEQTKTWDQVIVDRQPQLLEWAEICRRIVKRKIQILAFANNHYAGHAPATVEMFRQLWNAGTQSDKVAAPKLASGRLFD